jgi:hypothetical protein
MRSRWVAADDGDGGGEGQGRGHPRHGHLLPAQLRAPGISYHTTHTLSLSHDFITSPYFPTRKNEKNK